MYIITSRYQNTVKLSIVTKTEQMTDAKAKSVNQMQLPIREDSKILISVTLITNTNCYLDVYRNLVECIKKIFYNLVQCYRKTHKKGM